MTREEAKEILTHNWTRVDNPNYSESELDEAVDMAIEALSADAVQGDGRDNMKRYPNCQIRTSLGNCDAIGGFCTSVNAPICDAFHKLIEAAYKPDHSYEADIVRRIKEALSAEAADVEECDGCKYDTLIPQKQCLRCSRYWKDNYEYKDGDDE